MTFFKTNNTSYKQHMPQKRPHKESITNLAKKQEKTTQTCMGVLERTNCMGS